MNITLLIIDISVFNPRGNFLLKIIMVGQIKIIRAHKLKFQTAKNNFSYVNNKVKFNIKADYWIEIYTRIFLLLRFEN